MPAEAGATSKLLVSALYTMEYPSCARDMFKSEALFNVLVPYDNAVTAGLLEPTVTLTVDGGVVAMITS